MFFSRVLFFTFFEAFFDAIVTFYAGKDTIKGAWIALTHKHINMDTLIFFGAITAWSTSVLSLLGLEISSFGAIGTMIISFHLLGKFIESRTSKEIN